MARIKEQEIFVNPYVVQMDKFAESLQHLSKTFLNMEHYKGTLSVPVVSEKKCVSARGGRKHIR